MVTIAYVKEHLPNVYVRYNGELFTGRVRGRRNQFASVWIRPDGVEYLIAEYSWEAIVRTLNTGTPLKM